MLSKNVPKVSLLGLFPGLRLRRLKATIDIPALHQFCLGSLWKKIYYARTISSGRIIIELTICQLPVFLSSFVHSCLRNKSFMQCFSNANCH